MSAPGDYDNEEIGGMIGRRNRSTRRKPAAVPLCPPQTPHAARTRTRAAAVGSQRLTAELRHGHKVKYKRVYYRFAWHHFIERDQVNSFDTWKGPRDDASAVSCTRNVTKPPARKLLLFGRVSHECVVISICAALTLISWLHLSVKMNRVFK
jgi:hypothetical protein